jgi:hypothetical protein
MSFSFINYKNKKILYIDYTQCKTAQDTVNVIEEVRKEYLRTSEKYIALSDFTNAPVNNEYMDLVKKYTKELFDERTIKRASIGITGMKKILLNTFNLFSKKKMFTFDTKEEALEYLVQD